MYLNFLSAPLFVSDAGTVLLHKYATLMLPQEMILLKVTR